MHYAVLNESISYTGKIHHPETRRLLTHVNVGGWGLLEVTSNVHNISLYYSILFYSILFFTVINEK